jgi:hypothetical protein
VLFLLDVWLINQDEFSGLIIDHLYIALTASITLGLFGYILCPLIQFWMLVFFPYFQAENNNRFVHLCSSINIRWEIGLNY